jgi:hypothetical protein
MQTVGKQNNSFQARFLDEYVRAQVSGESLTLAEIGIRAGYSAKSAYSQASRLLKNVEIQKAISDKLARLSLKIQWNLARSLREGISQYELLKNGTAQEKGIAFKYKEETDRIMGLLVERKLIGSVRLPINRRPYKDIPLDQLHEEVLERLKPTPTGIEIDGEPDEKTEKTDQPVSLSV